MPVNLTAVRSELLPGLRKVTGQYKDLPVLYDKIFEMGKSNMAQEAVTSMRFLGLAQIKNDGGNTAFDNNAGERFKYNQIHIGLGLGFSFTRNAIDDNLYKKQFNPSNLGLQKSFRQTKEIYGANVFNTGTTFNAQINGDGVALFSTQHPIDGTTLANRAFVDADLNEASLLSSQAAIRANFRDNANLRLQARAKKVVVPIALEPIIIRLLKTDLRPGTSTNDVNAIPLVSGGIPGGYMVHDYLTSSFPWFVLTDQEGLIYLQRIPFETDMQVDFYTDILLVKAFERFSFAHYDWRAAYANFPTS